VPCHAPGETLFGETGKQWKGKYPPKGRHWRYSVSELDKLDNLGLIEWSKNDVPRIKKYSDEHNGKKIQDIWFDYKDPQYPIYPTEKNREMLEMIVEQSSDENSIILDCFWGSGTFLKAGLSKNRKVIGIDKSPIATKVIFESEELKNKLKFIKFDDLKSYDNIQRKFCF
ncbi:site-specific DNA-methyltransferase, partial [bacterium]|nr:site-specific DNA-methyltransferase [bacterium]